MLGDDDPVLGDETARGGTGGFHEALPIATGGLTAYCLRSLGGAYGLVSTAFGEEGEDGGFEGCVGSGLVAAAGITAMLDDVPVLGPLLAPLEGAATGLADLVAVRGGALGFGFAVGHGLDV